MNIELAMAVFAGISALSALIQVGRAAIHLAEYLSPADVDAILHRWRKRATEENWAVEQLGNVIDAEILAVMKRNIEEATERLKQSLTSAGDDDRAKDIAIADANRAICNELSRIKELNGGKLPGIENQVRWDSHSCG